MNLTSTLLSIAASQTAAQPAENAAQAIKLADRSIAAGTLTWGEAFQFLGVGLCIVFLTLAVLWLICELMGRVFQSIDAKKAAAAKQAADAKKLTASTPAAAAAAQLPPPTAAAVPTPAAAASVSPVEIPAAVFVAAAKAVMGNAPHRVVSVERVPDGVVLPVASAADDIPLAVIAAAVAAVLDGRPHRILNVRPVDMTWAREGRVAQHLSSASFRS